VLVVLGTDIIRRLAEGILARTLVGPRDEARESFWQHSLAVGARLLAEVHRRVDPKQAFVAGLLHDIGQLAIHQTNPEAAASESRAIGDGGHSELGAEMAGLRTFRRICVQQSSLTTIPVVSSALTKRWRRPY
jgi:putative nucleotidyltransferase with HDIG domain